ncbi:hypothetical protein LFZ1_12585 [Salmonella enterica subsp. enterica serovar Rubislaw str. SA20030553]|nr:hypothetical protein LFZ1_12585 [Salmonella enterica subsp. enterica serovar Rubislaw str. SA20030553]
MGYGKQLEARILTIYPRIFQIIKPANKNPAYHFSTRKNKRGRMLLLVNTTYGDYIHGEDITRVLVVY